MSSVTFVSALLRSSEALEYHRKYFDLFEPLANSRINLVVFISDFLLAEAIERYPRVKFEPVVLEDLESYRAATADDIRLPDCHSPKDTKKYMAIINAKTELVLRAINLDIPKTTHYGWIDFGITHITDTPQECLTNLKNQCERLMTPLLAIPGIWQLGYGNLTAEVVWRFCGGLFVGDRESVREFCLLSSEVFAKTTKETGVAVWEVNTWARLEREHGWKPDWYQADHNKSMLVIPESYLQSS